MNIVFAQKYLFPGSGTATYLLELKAALEARGHHVVPFTVAYDRAMKSEYSRFYVSPPGSPGETHLKDMQRSPWQALKLMGRATYSLETVRKAAALVDASGADVAYVNNICNYMSPSMLPAFKSCGIPVIMRVADCNLLCASHVFLRDNAVCTDCLDRGLWCALKHRCVKGSMVATAGRVASMWLHRLMRVYECVDLFITPSKFLKEILVQAGLAANRIQHLPSFCPGTVAHEERNHRGEHILFFGRVSAQKGIDTLIDAYALLRPAVPLVIAGGDRDGELDCLRRRAADVGVSDSVRFVGHQERHELDSLLRRAAFVVVPSKCLDVFPMSVLECFARGKPVIGSRVGGIPEQITPECGMLFEPGNVAELATHMKALLRDEPRRRRMGESALRRAERTFSLEQHCRALLGLFERLAIGEAVEELDAPGVERTSVSKADADGDTGVAMSCDSRGCR